VPWDGLYVSYTIPLVPYTIFKQNQNSVIHKVGLYCPDKVLSVYAINEYRGSKVLTALILTFGARLNTISL